MTPIDLKFALAADFTKADVGAEYFDAGGPDAVREMIKKGQKKYDICETIMKALQGGAGITIFCNTDVGNWFDYHTNSIWFSRKKEALPHLVEAGKDYTIPALVCLFHELGHAKQYKENSTWYESTVTVRDNAGVPYQIEYDNMQRHEDPLMRAMGYPIRKRYEFFVSEAHAAAILDGKAKVKPIY